MGKTKKILSFLLALIMVLALVPFNAIVYAVEEASGAEAQEQSKGSAVASATVSTAAEFSSAIAEAQAGDIIKVTADITGFDVTVNKDITLDLGGKTITDAYIKIKANVTIKNGSIKNVNESYPLVVKSGALTVEEVDIDASKSDRAIWLDGRVTLNFNSGSILATKGENNTYSKIYGVWVSTGATANINGGTITVDAGPSATAVAIFGNYVNTVNINGGKISTSGKTYSYAVWTDGDVTVTGGEIITNEKQYGYSSGITYGKNYAINTKGDVEISGGKITTNGPSGYLVNAGGSDQKVTISNVKFECVLSEADKTQGGHSEPKLIYGSSVTTTITGGSFEGVNEQVMEFIEVGATVTVAGTTYTKAEDGSFSEVEPKPELPTATVAPIQNNSNVLFGLTFSADSVTAEQLEAYGDYFADFVITFNKDLTLGYGEGTDGWLSGNYGDYGWINVPTDGKTISVEANKSYRVMDIAAELLGNDNLHITYDFVVEFVQEFQCGVYLTPEFIAENPDFGVEIGLSMFEPVEDENGNTVLGEEIKVECTDANGAPMQTTFTSKDISLVLPSAKVYPVVNPDLSFGLTFEVNKITDAQLDYYGDWYADFTIEFSVPGSDLTEIVLGTGEGADGWLSGQYDEWSENWVNVPFKNEVIPLNKPIKVMDFAAKIMGKDGLKITYREVYEGVEKFNCGVYLTPEFIEANGEFTVSVDLAMFEEVVDENGNVTEVKHDVVYTDENGKVIDKADVTVFDKDDVYVAAVAEVNGVKYATLGEALAAAAQMSGEVTITILDKVTLNQSLTGNYTSIKFVGASKNAEIYLDVQGYIEAPGKAVAFEDLKLSKSEGGYITNAGFMNVAFGIFNVESVNYTNCKFINGACASSGEVTFTECTFYRSYDKYSLWAYGDVDVTVNKCTFDDYRGIKMYSEGGAKTVDLTVTNTDFSKLTGKPAIVATLGNSITLSGNTYSAKGVLELEDNGSSNGIKIISNDAVTCISDAYPDGCGVIVDGKIYRSVAEAATVATAGSTVILLHNSAETVEFVEGVTLDKNGFTADGVTVAEPVYVAKIGDNKYATLEEAFAAAQAGETIVLLADATPALTSQRKITAASVIDLNRFTLTLTEDDLYFGTTTFKNGNIVVDPSVNTSTAAFWMFDGQTLTFDNVKITATGVSGCYLIGLEGKNAYLNITNGTEIIVENENIVNLIAVVSHNGTGKVTISDSKVSVSNINGRAFLGGSYVVENSDIDATGVKAGFYIKANQSLEIKGTSTVDISNLADGYTDGIYLANAEVVYTKADTATVNSTVTQFKTYVAQIGDNKYETLEDALNAAQAGDEVILLADVAEDVTVPAGVIFNGNGKQVGVITAAGEITFKGHTKTTNFGVQYTNTTINIIEGACLELTGTGRMVIGHGCTFNITGTITDAKTADKANITPSLIAAGASFTGAGVNFNVTNAYVKFTAYCSSKNSSANGTFNFDVENSIWEQTGSFVFSEPTSGKDPTFNLTLKNSVLGSTSHLVFAVAKGEIVFDNSNVNVGASRQIENRSTLTIKNGSVVNGAVATSSNAKNPGTIIVENATYAVTGEFTGSDVGTGTLVIKKGANITIGKITKANIVIDATDMVAGEIANFTANLSAFAGELSVINNDKLEAKIVDGKIVLSAKPVAKIGDNKYETLEEAIAAAKNGDEVVILVAGTYTVPSGKDITITGAVDGVVFDNIKKHAMGGASVTFNNVTFNYSMTEGHNGLQHSGKLVYNNCTFKGQVFLYGTSETFNNCTFNQTDVNNYNVWTYAADDVKFNGCTFYSAGRSLLIYSEGADLYANVVITDCDFISSNAVDGKAAIEMDSSLSAGIKVTIDAATTATGFGNGNVSGNSLWNNKKGNETAANNDITVVVNGVTVLAPVTYVAQIGDKKYTSLEDAIAAAAADSSITYIEILADYAQTSVNKINGYYDIAQSLTIGASKKVTLTGCGFAIRVMGNGASLTIDKNVTIEGLGVVANGFATSNENMIINGVLKALSLKQWTSAGSITVNSTGFVWLGYGDGQFDMAYGNGTLTVIGNGDKTVAQFKAGYSGIRGNKNTINLKDTYFEAGAWFTIDNNKNAVINLDNALLKVSGGDSTGTFTLGTSNVINMNLSSLVQAGEIVGGGKIVIDATGITESVQVIKANMANFKGTIEVIGGDYEVKADGVYVTAKKAVASVNGVGYATLEEAIAAAQNGDTIVLVADIADSATIKIVNKSITIDLAGHIISGTCNAGQASLIYIENNAALTVKDTVGEGKITYAQGSSNVGWTIDVEGKFVLESGTIELTGSWSIGYAVDVRPNAWGSEYTNPSVFVMNGGAIVSSDGAVRVASSSYDEYKKVSASFVMNDGTIDAAWDGVFIQQSNAAYDVLSFTMNGGTINSDLNPVRVYGPAPTSYVNGQNCMKITLAGGELNYTGTEAYEWVIDGILRVGGGSTVETIVENGTLAVSAEIANSSAAPAGYQWVANSNGTYGISKITVKFQRSVIFGDFLELNFNFLKIEGTKVYAKVIIDHSVCCGGANKEYYVEYGDTKNGWVFGTGGGAYDAISVKNIAAKEMGTNVCVQLFAGTSTDDVADVAISEINVFSIKAYAMTLLNKASSSATTKTAMYALLEYGAAAQIAFGHAKDKLVTNELTDAHASYKPSNVTTSDAMNVLIGEEYRRACSVTFTNSLEMNLYLKNLSDKRLNVLATYTTYLGTPVTVKLTADDLDYRSDGFVGIKISGISGANINSIVNITVCVEGETTPIYQMEYSIAIYAKTALGTTTDPAKAILYQAVLNYGSCIRAYLETLKK